jgi:hypothetical protein
MATNKLSIRSYSALAAGIFLGAIAGYLVAFSGYGAPVLLVFWVVINTLIVCLIANQNTTIIGLVPNIVMVLVTSIVVQIEHPRERYNVVGTLFFIVLISLSSLLISVPIYLLRRYTKNTRRPIATK